MQWLRLDIKLLPPIATEIENTVTFYSKMVEIINAGDKSQLREYTLMRAAIQARIEELDEFYENNSTDVRIQYFEKLRLKLKKLLMNNIFHEQDTMTNISPNHKKKATPRQTSSQTKKAEKRFDLADFKHQISEEKKKKKIGTGAVRDVKNTLSYKTKTENTQGSNSINFSNKSSHQSFPQKAAPPPEPREWGEIIFKLKLNASEYAQYLQKKAQMLNS